MMNTVGISCDNYKVSTFEKGLSEAGFTYKTKNLTSDLKIIKVNCEDADLPRLKALVKELDAKVKETKEGKEAEIIKKLELSTDVEDQFRFYLHKMRLDWNQMPLSQQLFLKDTFYAAWAQQMILYTRQETDHLTEEEWQKSFDKAMDKIGKHWEGRMKFRN